MTTQTFGLRYATLALDEPAEHVLRVRLHRPESANAMNTQMGLDLLDLWDRVNAAPARHRCIILTGSGERAFCAGGDLKERNGMTDEAWQAQHLIFERSIRALLACPVPVIGAVNGAAYGGGCEMALCCDFIYAAPTARFALPEVTLGIMPGAGQHHGAAGLRLGRQRVEHMQHVMAHLRVHRVQDVGAVQGHQQHIGVRPFH